MLKQFQQQIGGFKYITDSLNVLSSAGRRQLLSLPFLAKANDIQTALEETATVLRCTENTEQARILSLVAMKMTQLRDIKGTLNHLADKNVLSDVELFEIKHFAILSEHIREYKEQLYLSFLQIPNLNAAIDILDPEGKRVPHFYVYDQYSSVLASLRTQLSRMSDSDYDEKEIEAVRFQAQRLEDEIRKNLSRQLLPHAHALKNALHEIARFDILLAKAAQVNELQLCKPVIGNTETSYKGLFHPEIKQALQQQRKDFQPVDISIPMQPTVITGANMAGKSVLLKSVALAQTMAQFGFYVPAKSATIVPVEKIVICAGDGEDEMKGLSSFAAEMLRLNTVIENAEKSVTQLVLIDELARTTNPVEGRAIVCGVLDFLVQHNVRSLITTHYTIETACRKLRVKGFTENKSEEKIDIRNINDYIDYSLQETTENEVPHEAVRIAEIIGVDKDLLEKINEFL